VSEDKRTKIGTGELQAVAPSPTPAPEAHQAKTSYLPDPGDPLLGQTLAGRYQIVRKLGEGGMGAVYLAIHTVLEKQVALKVLHGEFARKPDLVERFMQEARAASRISHENVIDISDFGTTPEGLVFFAMELLNGHDLHEEIARARIAGARLPWDRSKKIFLQICAALTAAHAKGIIHRDLKPENVYLVEFLGEGDFVKLLDFGIAKLTEVGENDRKLTRTGMLFGTPEYMSPEQARGDQVDHRVDVYAMGCILFQLVTGRVPFEAENFMGVLSLHLTEPPPVAPPEMFDQIGAPREIAGVIARALEKDRGARWQTIEDLANGVRAVCGEAPVIGGRSTGVVPAQRHTTPTPAVAPITQNRQRTQWTGSLNVPTADDAPRAKSKLPFLLGGGVVAIGVAVAVAMSVGGDKPKPPPEPTVSSGSTGSNGSDGSGGAPIVTVTPDAAVAPLPPPPKSVVMKLASIPKNAQVRESPDGKPIGKTPLRFKLAGSHEPRRFYLSLKGYGDAIVEIVPNEAEITHTETLEKGTSGTPTVNRVGSGEKPGPGSAVTDPGSAAIKPLPPEAKPDAGVKKPPPDDECPDPDVPCLKADPSRDAGTAP
jgi:serine/threonine protein kinase